MNINQFNTILDKINKLSVIMVKDALHTSLVERDLMRMYIKQLYESTFEEFNNVKE
ncbi:MAG: hypothetical protein KBA06_05170 [Saprospiraceae bacterium]|nr:hypothetical protein [Saprospiraceae bacterium]